MDNEKIRDEPSIAMTCRVCGCTDDLACDVHGVACFWVEDDLCSACAPIAAVVAQPGGLAWALHYLAGVAALKDFHRCTETFGVAQIVADCVDEREHVSVFLAGLASHIGNALPDVPEDEIASDHQLFSTDETETDVTENITPRMP